MGRLELAQHGLGVYRAHVREVNRRERVEHLGALLRGQQRRMLHRCVRVRGDVDQQRPADFFGPPEILDMSVMQRVEGAVHHGDLPPVLLQILYPMIMRLQARDEDPPREIRRVATGLNTRRCNHKLRNRRSGQRSLSRTG